MKDLLIVALFFLTGAPVAYLLFRRKHIKEFGTWTVSDRMFCMLCSVGGWASVLTALFTYAADNDKPASW